MRAIAAGGSAALYAPLAPRTAASLEAGAAAAAVVAAGATGLALFVSTGGMSVVAVPLLVLAPVAVLAADLLPRALAQAQRQVLPTVIRTFAHSTLAVACAPLRLLEATAARLTGGKGDHPVPALGQVLSDLLRRERPGEETTLSSPQVIQRIFQFQETRVYEVMVPLIHIYAVRDDAPIEEAVTSAAREKLSRVPVFQQRMYNIIGIVHAFDLLGETRLAEPCAPSCVRRSTCPRIASRISSSASCSGGASTWRSWSTSTAAPSASSPSRTCSRRSSARSRTSTTSARCSIETLADGAVQVEGGMEIERLNELFPWRLPAGDYETIAGLVVTQLGRIPRAGVRRADCRTSRSR